MTTAQPRFVCALVIGALGVAGCLGNGSPTADGAGIRVNVSPLTLPGGKDVCYGLYVQNGAGDVVAYLPHVCSSQYGNDAGGDISYVVPCDAQPLPTAANAQNTVTLVLEGIDLDATAATSWLDETQYKNPCGWPDPSVGTQALATVGTQKLPLDTSSPVYAGPGADANVNWDGFKCQRVVTCEENADAEVTFNLTVMRDADQGFFDIAVNFEDIFCSAKVDCAYPDPNGGPIELVFDPVTGKRVQTVVWAFACTDGDPAGSDATTATHLYMDDLVLDCGGTLYTIPASAGPGNIYPIAGTPPTPAPAPLVQAMEFEGREQIHNGDEDADKLYWNVALGLKASFFSPVSPACTLHTKATASKGPLPGGVTPLNTDYPVVIVNVPISDSSGIICSQHGLDGTGSHGGVTTGYTGPRPDGSGFATTAFGNEGAPAGGGIVTGPIGDGPTNPCDSNPCMNDGVCSANGAGYDCVCGPAWTGATCTTPACDPAQHTAPDDCGCPSVDCGMFGSCDATGACECPAGTSRDGAACVSTLAGFAYIPKGSFTMGSPWGEVGRQGIEVQHTVTLTKSFWMMATEVTQAEWESLMGNNPSNFVSIPANGNTADTSRPVEKVSWYDAIAYMNALSTSQSLTSCYDVTCTGTPGVAGYTCSSVTSVSGCTGYRLPTEAEWEYAARAGTQTATYAGDLMETNCEDEVLLPIAWSCGNNGSNGSATYGTKSVQQKDANAWGLYDMLGNVWEWIGDRYAPYSGGSETDPTGPVSGAHRVFRGGAWYSDANPVRAAFRGYGTPSYRGYDFGFRAVRSIP